MNATSNSSMPLTLEEARRILKGPFGQQLVRLAPSHMTWVLQAGVGPSGEIENLRNGTCFFLQTPQRLFGVTARHVIDEFRRCRSEDPKLRTQVGNLVINPIERLIDAGVKTDIATFEITQAELDSLGKLPIALWPPDTPDQDGAGVLIAGYPALARKGAGPRSCVFGIYTACGVAQRITERQLSCQVEWDEVQESHEAPLPPRNFETGGMSGGPIMYVRERSGFVSFPIAGVVFEGDPSRDIIFGERADQIRADGSIRS